VVLGVWWLILRDPGKRTPGIDRPVRLFGIEFQCVSAKRHVIPKGSLTAAKAVAMKENPTSGSSGEAETKMETSKEKPSENPALPGGFPDPPRGEKDSVTNSSGQPTAHAPSKVDVSHLFHRLVVTARVGGAVDGIDWGEIRLSRTTGGVKKAPVSVSKIIMFDKNGASSDAVEFTYLVGANSTGPFTLHMPDGQTIPLDELLNGHPHSPVEASRKPDDASQSAGEGTTGGETTGGIGPSPRGGPRKPSLPSAEQSAVVVPQQTWRGHTDAVWTVAIAPTAKALASGSSDRTVRLWDPTTGNDIATLSGHKGQLTCLAYSRNGALVVSASNERDDVRVWDTETHKLVTVLNGIAGVRAVAFSADGTTLVCGGIQGLAIYDVSSWKQILAIDANPAVQSGGGYAQGVVSSVAGTPDNRYWVTGSSDSTVRIWDAASGERKATLAEKFDPHKNNVYSVAIAPDGKTLASAHADGTIRLWNLNTKELKGALTGHTGKVLAVAYSPVPNVVCATSTDKTLKVWDVAARKELASFPGQKDWSYGLAVSMDGRWAVTASRDGMLRTWQLPK